MADQEARGDHATVLPVFSIIIPTFRRVEKLRACLAGITRLDFDRARFEVVVVDDGSPQPLDEVLAEFRDRIALRFMTQSRAGPAAARNAGAALARGRYLAFLDDDCTPALDWLAVLHRALARDERQLLGGSVENALSSNAYADASERINRFVYQYNRTELARERFFTTNNLAVSAELFRALGGFTNDIPSATAEDKEFCDRWRANGLVLTHVPDAVVYHSHDMTFAQFLRQHFNYGRGILAFRLIRRARHSGDIIPEPLSFYVDLVFSPTRQPAQKRSWTAFLLILIAQLATFAGAVHQAMRWPFGQASRLARRERK